MELNSNQTELPPDDFFSLMDMNEDVGDLFDIQGSFEFIKYIHILSVVEPSRTDCDCKQEYIARHSILFFTFLYYSLPYVVCFR